MRPLRLFAVLLVLITSGLFFQGCSDDSGGNSGKIHAPCPFMPAKEIQEQFYVDYEGQRYYFCCQICVNQFKGNPKKWIAVVQKSQPPSESETNQVAP